MVNRIALVPLALIFTCAACADETTGPTQAEFDELCGQDEPLRILPLAPDRQSETVQSLVIGVRYLFQLVDQRPMRGFSGDLWSVGPCGEQPIELATAVDNQLKVYEPFPDVVFACRDADQRMVALDPTGARAANPVFATRDCFALPTPDGLLTILGEDEDTGTLVFQPWPSDPFTETAEQIVLAEDVKARALPEPEIWADEDHVLDATQDEAFAITADDELLAIALDDFEITTLATGVRAFEVSDDGRWLVWQSVELVGDDPSWAAGPIFLLDRESGEVAGIGEAALTYTSDPMMLAPLGLLYFYEGGSTRYVRLANLESFTLQLDPIRVIDESRVLVGNASAPPYHVVDLSTSAVTTLYEGERRAMTFGAEELTVLESEGGALVSVTYAGESRVLAPHVLAPYEVTHDHRVITPFAVNNDGVGQLVIVDPETHEEQFIADGVSQASAELLEDDDGQPIVSYMVIDSDPSRHGIWIAKPSK